VRMRIAVFGGCLLPAIHLISSAAMNNKDANLTRLVSVYFFLLCLMFCITIFAILVFSGFPVYVL